VRTILVVGSFALVGFQVGFVRAGLVGGLIGLALSGVLAFILTQSSPLEWLKWMFPQ
jgi:hypothetical protein